jgi:hypothetical protein
VLDVSTQIAAFFFVIPGAARDTGPSGAPDA